MEEDHDLDACRALRENRKRRRNAYIQKLTVLK
jgi:predicted nucleic acid-binding Zn ribbon protein